MYVTEYSLNFISCLLCGADTDKVSLIWHLTSGLNEIKSLMRPHLVIIPSHVRRKETKMADNLANFVLGLDGSDFICDPTIHMDHPGQGMHFSRAQHRQLPIWGIR